MPSTPLPRAPGVARPTATAEQLIERRARRAAAARGLNEAVTWSFISESEAEPFGGSAWILANPISEEMKAMRPSLLPGLLAAAARNAARGAESIRLFEIGRRYLGDERAADAGPRPGRAARAAPLAAARPAAFDALTPRRRRWPSSPPPARRSTICRCSATRRDVYHPGQSGRLCLGPKNVLAEFGALHPRIARAFDLDGPVVAAEIFLDAIPAEARRQPAICAAPMRRRRCRR